MAKTRPKNPHAAALGKLGGKAKSDRKTAAARANAKKPRPGRRRKKTPATKETA